MHLSGDCLHHPQASGMLPSHTCFPVTPSTQLKETVLTNILNLGPSLPCQTVLTANTSQELARICIHTSFPHPWAKNSMNPEDRGWQVPSALSPAASLSKVHSPWHHSPSVPAPFHLCILQCTAGFCCHDSEFLLHNKGSSQAIGLWPLHPRQTSYLAFSEINLNNCEEKNSVNLLFGFGFFFNRFFPKTQLCRSVSWLRFLAGQHKLLFELHFISFGITL